MWVERDWDISVRLYTDYEIDQITLKFGAVLPNSLSMSSLFSLFDFINHKWNL